MGMLTGTRKENRSLWGGRELVLMAKILKVLNVDKTEQVGEAEEKSIGPGEARVLVTNDGDTVRLKDSYSSV